ncbi:MAG: hypothetical protein LBP85_02280, partial [Prevotellaceae bacterium]|nr:hypothetical protein [Prevotellaceae bacterium]
MKNSVFPACDAVPKILSIFLRDENEHFGHTTALLVALAVALLFTYVPFLVQKWYLKSDRARKYL